MQRTHADPAPRRLAGDAGSRRPRVLPVLVVGVLLAACVRGLLVESFVVPSAALSPTVLPGDRVLVWKASPQPGPGDVVLVDTGEVAPGADAGEESLVARVLGAAADALGVRTSGRDEPAVVAGAIADGGVVTSAPVEAVVPPEDVVGVVGLRFWPLDRFGPVSAVAR